VASEMENRFHWCALLPVTLPTSPENTPTIEPLVVALLNTVASDNTEAYIRNDCLRALTHEWRSVSGINATQSEEWAVFRFAAVCSCPVNGAGSHPPTQPHARSLNCAGSFIPYHLIRGHVERNAAHQDLCAENGSTRFRVFVGQIPRGCTRERLFHVLVDVSRVVPIRLRMTGAATALAFYANAFDAERVSDAVHARVVFDKDGAWHSKESALSRTVFGLYDPSNVDPNGPRKSIVAEVQMGAPPEVAGGVSRSSAKRRRERRRRAAERNRTDTTTALSVSQAFEP